MKKIKVLLAAVLSITVVLGTAVPTFAAEPVSDVKIEVNATDMNVSVTVPSTLPIVFCEDGTNAFPEHWTIRNVSALAGIHLKQIDMNAGGTGWTLVKDAQQVKTQIANGKAIRFSAGILGTMQLVQPDNGSESEKGTAMFGETDICIASGETQDIIFDVERGAFTETQVSAKAFTMELTFEFN